MDIHFNNKNQVGSWSLYLALLVLIALGAVAANYLLIEVRNQTLDISLWGFLVFSVVLFYFGGFNYVDIALSAEKVDVKFYNLFPLGRQYNRILVPTEKIKKIKVNKGLGIIGRKLKIEGTIQGRHALFPSVGLAACTRQQLQQIQLFIDTLNKEK